MTADNNMSAEVSLPRDSLECGRFSWIIGPIAYNNGPQKKKYKYRAWDTCFPATGKPKIS